MVWCNAPSELSPKAPSFNNKEVPCTIHPLFCCMLPEEAKKDWLQHSHCHISGSATR